MSEVRKVSTKVKESLVERLLRLFLTFFSDIKVFPCPPVLVYDPGSYFMKGKDVRKVMSLVQPGDILLRKFKNYLNGPFIPGYFSHSALYVGPVKKAEKKTVTRDRGKKIFQYGKQMVIHALAEGVIIEDLLSFCRCDYLAVLRFPKKIRCVSGARSLPIPSKEYATEETDILEQIEAGQELSFRDVFPIIYRMALKNVGRPYDFQFDFANFDRLSCTEFIYLCTKCIGPFFNLSPTQKRVLFLFKKSMIKPDALLLTNLEIIYVSGKVKAKKVAKALRN